MLVRQKARMDELCELVTDGTHDSPKLQTQGAPFIKGKHISSGFVDLEHCDFITWEDHKTACQRVKPKRHDILFSNIGSVGDTAIVKTLQEFSIKNVALFRADTRKIDPTYLYYLILSPEFRRNILNVRSGSAQPFISLINLRAFEISYLSDKQVQGRIASILSSYDNLIENNLRRIKILEELAQLLYREWFVKFRFPGHDKVKMVDSPQGKMPEGWKILPLGEVAATTDFVANGSFASIKANVKYMDRPGYAVLIRGKDSNNSWNGNYVYVDEHAYRFLAKSKVFVGDIVICNVGNVGTVFKVPDLGLPMTLGPNSVLMRPKICPTYFYWFLTSNVGQHLLSAIVSGSAQPKFNKTDLRNLLIPYPPPLIQQDFENFSVLPSLQGESIRKISAVLRQTRDLLLSKLISGDLDVSDLDIKVREDLG
jgi:type I restriction enzyme, S subunit